MTHHLAGKKQSPEHIAARVASRLANGGYADVSQMCTERNKSRAGIKHSEEHKAKISAGMKGKRNSLGTERSLDFRKRLSEYWAENVESHNHYVDGKGAERIGERITAMSKLEYRLWRESVFKRDDWTCQACGKRGCELHADHIKPWSTHPDLRYELSNGRALCVACHRKTPTYGSKAKKGKSCQ